MKRILLLFILTPWLCLSQTELVTNGTFTTDLTSWIISGNVVYNNFFSNGCAAFSGANTAVDGIASQTITATPGATLTVTLNYGRRGITGETVGGLFEIIDNVTSAIISSTTLTAPDVTGIFITTSFTIVAPSNSLLIRFTDQTTETFSRDFYFNTISITQPTPLPIELIDFDAKGMEKAVKLYWQTASETNNDYFTIERSPDGFNWEEVIRIDGAGNSSNLLSYSTIDHNPYYGTSYYRLKQTDFDGQFEYSQIKSIYSRQLANSTIVIFPNPAENLVTVKGDKYELEQLKIYNTLGQDVTSFTNQSILDNSKLIIDLSNLSKGMYYVRTKTTSNKVYKQ